MVQAVNNYPTYSRAYSSYLAMKRRCTDPSDISYCRYGARGIKVCDRWLESFENFLADMGERPEGFDLDRINNEGHYDPGNCRWISHKQNARNRSNNRLLTYQGITRTLAEWAEVTGLGVALQGRIRNGWSVEDALTRPLRPRAEWTEEEIAILRANYHGKGALRRCQALFRGRSRISIAQMASKIGLTRCDT